MEQEEKGSRYYAFTNLIENGDFERDDDIDGFPDGWIPWPWTVEEELDLRRAIFDFLDTTSGAIIRPRLTTRYPFFGKRSLNVVSADGKTSPGVYTTAPFTPGIYTLSLYAKNPGEGNRKLGLFLANGGRLFEIGRRWRNIVHSERIPFYIKNGEISLRDWTFSPGELLMDRVVLLKLPFDIRYQKRIEMSDDQGMFVIDFSAVENAILPIGINLEIRTPTGEVVRKNIEGTLEQPVDQVTFEFTPQAVGHYRLKVEIYDLRTADVIFTDEDIEVVYRGTDAGDLDEEQAETPKTLSFFPVGIRVRGHELGDLRGKGFNTVLVAEPTPEVLQTYSNYLNSNKMNVFLEVIDEVGSDGCPDSIVDLIRASRLVEGFSGWFLHEGFSLDPPARAAGEEGSTLRCLKEANPDLPIVFENYLPSFSSGDGPFPVSYVALDPNPVSEPLRPLYTIGLWADRLAVLGDEEVRTIGMPQVFGGWPVAHRHPSYTEVRAMTYLAILHGARGIIYRDFSSLRPFFNRPDAPWDIRKVPELWERIPELNRELMTLSPFFLNGEPTREGISLLSEGYIDHASWRNEENLLLVAVNVYDGEVDGGFLAKEGTFVDRGSVLFEDRTIEWDGRTFFDHFFPFETHVYKLTLAAE